VPALSPNVSPLPETSSVVIVKPTYTQNYTKKEVPVCGGVIVGKHLIVTAAHCVGKVNSEVNFVTRDLWFESISSYEVATVVESNTSKDIAYLYSNKEVSPAAGIRTPKEGEFKLIVRRFQVSRDYASQVGRLETQLNHGDSGSGIFNIQGYLLGIVTSCNTKEKVIINNNSLCSNGGYYSIL
jgi:V8-like Glu-specific endopeptidase